MSKRGACERDYAPTQGNMRKARVEARRVDAIQVLMAAARTRTAAVPQQPPQAAAHPGAAGQVAGLSNAGASTAGASALLQPSITAVQPALCAPCTHCGTILPVSADSCALRQCCSCLDVFCSLCSVTDYEEREDRVFCLSCMDDQAMASHAPHGGSITPSRGDPACASGPARLSLGLTLPATGRWGQLEQFGFGGGAAGHSPYLSSRTPQPGSGRRKAGGAGVEGIPPGGAAACSSRSHRGFSALLAHGGGGGC